MLKVLAKGTVKKESVETFKSVASDLIDASRKEEGNIKYELYQDTKEENVFFFVEDWKDEDALKLHEETEHFKTILPKLAEMLAKEIEINILKLEK